MGGQGSKQPNSQETDYAEEKIENTNDEQYLKKWSVDTEDAEKQQLLLDSSTHSKTSEQLQKENQWLLDCWSVKNVAIPLTYFSVGFTYYFIATPLVYYMVDELDASGAEQEVIITLQTVPWSFKLFYGFISDTMPVFGERRKPYLIAGWVVFGVCNVVLSFLETPDLKWLSILVFVQVVAYLFSDVMADSLVVERAKMESADNKGTLQATAYMMRAVGYLLGSIGGACLYNSDEWGWGLTISEIFALNAIIPLVAVLPFLTTLYEQPMTTSLPTQKEELQNLWDLVQLRSVWRPLTFVFFYNMCQVSNASWSSFLIDGLGFSEFSVGCITIADCVVTWLGLWIYKKFLFTKSWRLVYIIGCIVVAVFSAGQLILEFQINEYLGLPDYLFAIGDDAAKNFVIAIQFLPVCRMYLGLCPNGSEGMAYAMLTTFSNCAYTLADDISTLLTMIWNVGNDTLEEGDYTGMWKLSLLTSFFQIFPLIFISLLPATPREQRELQKSKESSFWGGFAFVSALFITWVWTLVESVLEIIWA